MKLLSQTTGPQTLFQVCENYSHTQREKACSKKQVLLALILALMICEWLHLALLLHKCVC